MTENECPRIKILRKELNVFSSNGNREKFTGIVYMALGREGQFVPRLKIGAFLASRHRSVSFTETIAGPPPVARATLVLSRTIRKTVSRSLLRFPTHIPALSLTTCAKVGERVREMLLSRSNVARTRGSLANVTDA